VNKSAIPNDRLTIAILSSYIGPDERGDVIPLAD
jgi:hypothetical protein